MLFSRYVLFSFLLVVSIPVLTYGQTCPFGTQVGTDCDGYSEVGCCTGNTMTWCPEPGLVCQLDCTNHAGPSHTCCNTLLLRASCLGLYNCLNNCPLGDFGCVISCSSNADSTADTLYTSLTNCVLDACTTLSNSSCVGAALSANGACSSEFISCIDHAEGTLFCDNPAIQDCVCASDPTCCGTWSSGCAQKVASLGCASCAPANTCGWRDTGGYFCSSTASSDPTGTYPMVCGGDSTCTPDCVGKECGPDGCGGKCGTCTQSKTCIEATGQCVNGGPCAPDCDGKECGPDGCGGKCGTCAPSTTCAETTGQCVNSGPCEPVCDGKECGSNGCGGTCGACAPPTACVETTGQCSDPTCAPDCAGKECGPDGCGDVCGECLEGGKCTQNYICEGGGIDTTDASDGDNATDSPNGDDSSGVGTDSSGTPISIGGSVECPAGTVPKYNGLCVEDDTARIGVNEGAVRKTTSGCAAGGAHTVPIVWDTWPLLLMGLLLGFVCRQRA